MIIPEIKINKILYATDLSEDARYAFSYALSLADTYGANFTILHVLNELPKIVELQLTEHIGKDEWNKIKQRHFDEARKALIGKRRDGIAIKEVLDKFSEDNSSMIDEILIEKGNPVKRILETAKERNCDLVVMGIRGTGTLHDTMFGSTARKVVRRLKIPALLVRLPEAD